MTTIRPEQMRALVDAAANLTVDNDWDATVIADVMAALVPPPTNSDEMHDVVPPAIRKLNRAGYHGSAKQLAYLLTTDNAPQENHDD